MNTVQNGTQKVILNLVSVLYTVQYGIQKFPEMCPSLPPIVNTVTPFHTPRLHDLDLPCCCCLSLQCRFHCCYRIIMLVQAFTLPPDVADRCAWVLHTPPQNSCPQCSRQTSGISTCCQADCASSRTSATQCPLRVDADQSPDQSTTPTNRNRTLTNQNQRPTTCKI